MGKGNNNGGKSRGCTRTRTQVCQRNKKFNAHLKKLPEHPGRSAKRVGKDREKYYALKTEARKKEFTLQTKNVELIVHAIAAGLAVAAATS